MTIHTKSFNYKRIVIKISGEMLMGQQEFGIDQAACQQLARALRTLLRQNLEIAVVIGGGNIFRGIHLENCGVQRSAADQMGMLSTLINGIALKQALHARGVDAKVMSALECPKVAESYSWQKAIECINSKTVLIFVGGTGNPYFTTDTAAALRACEIGADLLVKATKVNGIYDKDPMLYPEAKKYAKVTYSQILAEQLGVMDATAIALCQSNKLPVYVFNMHRLIDHPELGEHLFDGEQGSFITEN